MSFFDIPPPLTRDPEADRINHARWHADRAEAEDTVTAKVREQRRQKKAEAEEAARRKGAEEAARTNKPAQQPASRSDFWDPWQEAALLPDFPTDVLPDVLRTIVEDDHRQMGTDVTGTAMAYLVAVGAALDDRIEVKVQRHGAWTENPRLWVALVGDPSIKKTPILDAALVPIYRHDAKHQAIYAMLKAEWDKLSDKEKKGQEEPRPPCFVTNSATIEALGELLRHNQRGLLFHADELAGWIGAMDRYHGKAGGASADRAFWLQAFQGKSHTTHRIGRGNVFVPNASVSVVGGIQPGKLQTMTDLSVDGLLQRFVPVVLRYSELGEDRPRNQDALNTYRAHIQALLDAQGKRTLTLDEAGHVLKEAAFQRLHDATKDYQADLPAFAGFLGKAPAILMRLALVLHFADPASLGAGSVIAAETVRRAIRLMEDCIIGHAHTLYAEIVGTGRNREHGSMTETRAIASWLIGRQTDTLKLREMSRALHCCRGVGVKDLERKLDVLIAAGWLTPNLPGLNATSWTLAPGLRQAFVEQAIIERERKASLKGKILRESVGKRGKR